MSNEKVDIPIKVTLDGEDIKKLVKEENNSERKNDEMLKRDEFLLELMEHYYEEDERRNELIDSKNSQMIVLTGAMLTLQVTLFSNLFVTHILKSRLIFCFKIGLGILMISSFVFYIFSMYLFINAYAFNSNYLMVPNPTYLAELKEFNIDKPTIIEKMLITFEESVDANDELIMNKVKKGKWGFYLLGIGVFLTLIFIGITIFALSYGL